MEILKILLTKFLPYPIIIIKMEKVDFLWRFCEFRKYLLFQEPSCDTIEMLSIFK